MSLTPITPNLKSFWSRPEGKTGMLFLAAGGIGAGYGLYLLLPYLITMVSNTLTLVGLSVALFAVLYVLFNGTFQTLVKFSFKSIMRFLTGLFIEIDPIGILKNFVAEMQKQQEMLQDQISKLSAAKKQLESNIDMNGKKAAKAKSMALEAKRMQDSTQDPMVKQDMAYKIAENVSASSRLEQTNKELQSLLQNLDHMYQLLIRWSRATQYYIDDRSAQVQELTLKRKAVNAAFSAMSSAKRILRGNADDNALYDQTLEYLAEDASNKLGEMEDFARVAGDFMTNIDLENGATNRDAIAQLEEMSRKLLPPGAANPGFIDSAPSSSEKLQPIEVQRNKSASDYEDLIK